MVTNNYHYSKILVRFLKSDIVREGSKRPSQPDPKLKPQPSLTSPPHRHLFTPASSQPARPSNHPPTHLPTSPPKMSIVRNMSHYWYDVLRWVWPIWTHHHANTLHVRIVQVSYTTDILSKDVECFHCFIFLWIWIFLWEYCMGIYIIKSVLKGCWTGWVLRHHHIWVWWCENQMPVLSREFKERLFISLPRTV